MPATIFSGTKVKTLKKIVDLFNGAQIHSSTVDPTSVATSAPIGSILLNETTGNVYRKIDAGSSINWVPMTSDPVVSAIGASDIDWNLLKLSGGVYTKTLAANTTFTFSNITAGEVIVVRLTNTASNYTVTWPTVKWPGGTAPTMTTGARSDMYTFISDGTDVYGSYVQEVVNANPAVVAPISASEIDWTTLAGPGGVYTKTLSANTTFTFAGVSAGQTIAVRLTNTASNYTVTWPTVKWSGGTVPTMTVGAKSDVYTFISDGTDIFGSYIQDMS